MSFNGTSSDDFNKVEYAYSHNDEDFTDDFSTLLDIIVEANELESIEDAVGLSYWVGEKTPVKPDIVADNLVHRILDDADDFMYEEVGEIYDNEFSSVSKEAKFELQSMLEQWTNKHVKLHYYTVKNIKKTELTKGDVE
jgi:hypothetical protein